MSLDFPAFALSEEHEALRESVRALADDKIAPRAAEVDRTSEFPWDVYEALVKADLQAVHIPEAYGGAGADAIATAIVIEEVARACASSSLRPCSRKRSVSIRMCASISALKSVAFRLRRNMGLAPFRLRSENPSDGRGQPRSVNRIAPSGYFAKFPIWLEIQPRASNRCDAG